MLVTIIVGVLVGKLLIYKGLPVALTAAVLALAGGIFITCSGCSSPGEASVLQPQLQPGEEPKETPWVLPVSHELLGQSFESIRSQRPMMATEPASKRDQAYFEACPGEGWVTRIRWDFTTLKRRRPGALEMVFLDLDKSLDEKTIINALEGLFGEPGAKKTTGAGYLALKWWVDGGTIFYNQHVLLLHRGVSMK
jgi:hypothetical protein